MAEIFDIYLAKANQPESAAYAELSLPATPYQMLDALDKLRLGEYEDLYWEVTEYHDFEELSSVLDESCGLHDLNALAQKLSELDERQSTAFAGLLQMEQAKGGPLPISRLIDLAYSTDRCHVVDEVLNDSQLGLFCAESGFVPGTEDLSDSLFELLDFEQIGREHRKAVNGVLVERGAGHPGGYVERNDALVEAYKTLDLTPKQPDYTILLEASKGSFNDSDHDSDKTVQLKLPAAPEALDAVREAGWRCLDCQVPALTEMVSGEEDIHSLNRLAQRMADMSPNDINTYKALLEATGCPDLDRAELLMDEIETYSFSPQFSSPIELARWELSVLLQPKAVELISPHVNMYQYGQTLLQDSNCVMTSYGMIERNNGQPIQKIEIQPTQGGMGGMSQ